ncbi:MAG: DUF58 domain-containing protein [Pseudomonadota bacterium]
MVLRDATGPTTSPDQVRHSSLSQEVEAQALAQRLPDLLIESMRIASTISHGIHGRRRAGTGETFWQFRQYENTDAAAAIDWRRSASSDHLYIREREWEAAHTFWLWADLSASMNFQSHLSSHSKRDRALVLLLAIAGLLVKSGERVGLIGLSNPTASRDGPAHLARVLAANAHLPVCAEGLPPAVRLARFSGVIMIGDFLDPPAELVERVRTLAAAGVAGHLVQVLDPAEETLPYNGRAEFHSPESHQRWIADHVESLRDKYFAKLAMHKAEISEQMKRIGWSHLIHHTDRPAAEPLLQLILRLQEPDTGGKP